MEHSRDGSYDRHDKGTSSALHNLIGYINDPSNPLKKYEEEVVRLLQTVSEEFEQLKVEVHTELKKKIEDLRKCLKESERYRARYRSERDDFRKILICFNKEKKQNLLTENEPLKREIEELKNILKQKETEWAKKIKDSEETSDTIIKGQKLKIEKIQHDIKQRDIKIRSLEETLEKNRFGFSDRSELKKKFEDSQKQLNDTNDKLQRTFAKLNQTEKELEETKTRLSKSMGDKLTDNNPNIADLSDKNRPINLAERYAELYDNQWTDAYEAVERYFHSEEDVIQGLLEIIKNVMEFCKDKAKGQLEHLQRNLTLSDYQEDKYVPDNIRKQLKDLRKALSPTSKHNLYKVYVSKLRKTTDQTLRLATKIEPFVKECFEICWYMSVQDPPIVFSPLARDGDALNTDIYKPYTSSGSRILFVVWPALLLHENGPVLAKGVAQGIKVKRETPIAAWADNADMSEVTLKTIDHGGKQIPTRGGVLSTTPYQARVSPAQHLEKHFSKNTRYEGANEDRHRRSKSSEEAKPSNRQSTMETRTVGTEPNDCYRVHKHGSETEPTHEEMRLYLQYAERCDFSGAKNALGNTLYIKCLLMDRSRPLRTVFLNQY